jgi:hypothetical protein
MRPPVRSTVSASTGYILSGVSPDSMDHHPDHDGDHAQRPHHGEGDKATLHKVHLTSVQAKRPQCGGASEAAIPPDIRGRTPGDA